jgi:ribosome-associated protein
MKGRDIALYAARVAEDKKSTDIVIYDVRGLTDITDYFVLATAHSRSQIRAVIETIRRELKAAGVKRVGMEGDSSGQWVLIDFADCVIHVFSPQLREYYSLESLWGDAPKVDWKKEPPVELKIPARATAATSVDDE